MEESGGGSPLILTGLLALIVTGSGVYALQEPLKSSRPTAEGFGRGQPTSRIPAHLWEDPVRVAKAAEGASSTVSGQSPAGFDEGTGRLVVLAMTLAADDSPLSREQRLRDRYAVWAALDTMGFEAADGSHLYVTHSKADRSPDCAVSANESDLMFIYELATRNRLNASPFAAQENTGDARTALEKIRGASQVLVVWAEDRLFEQSSHPLACLRSVVGEIEGVPEQFTLRIVGPNSSDTLRKVDDFIQKAEQDEDRKIDLSGAHFYSAMATTDTLFFAQEENAGTTDWESQYLTRTIGSDLDLSRVMVEELRDHGLRLRTPEEPRGWKKTDSPREQYHRVLLISEWDTYYGRALPLSFAISLLTHDEDQCQETASAASAGCVNTPGKILREFREDPKEWEGLPEIQHVSYLRGLDGLKVDQGAQDESDDRSSRGPEAHPEDASGPAQLDYVRRLAMELDNQSADQPIRAVGILGSDVYDKLLLIRALRDTFPSAVFFTTDLDARLWNQAELKWTRNLVVASSLGLRLVEHGDEARSVTDDPADNEVVETVRKRQSQLPPFRDNYQTSVYYAALLALGLPEMKDGSGEPIHHPRLFEIAQSGPLLLERYSEGNDICDNRVRAFGRIGCAVSHIWSEFIALTGDRQWFFRFGFFGVIGVVFALVALRRKNLLQSERMSYLEMFGLWGGIAITYFFVLAVSTEGVTYEPFALFDGVSIWPTEVLRVVVFFLSLYLIGRAHRLLGNNMAKLSWEFKLHPDTKPPDWRRDGWGNLRWILVGRDLDHGGQRKNEYERPKMAMKRVWQDYFHDGGRMRRTLRIMSIMVVYVLVLRILVFGGFEPVIPVRDPFGFAIDRLCILLSVGAMAVLLFYIVDAVLLAERIIKLISTHDHDWPQETYDAWGLEPGADPRRKKALSEWLAIRLIGMRTEIVGRLAVGPFFVIALFLVSRASFFDRWHIPVPVWTAMGLNMGLAVFAVVILWRSAEGARSISAEIISRLQIEAETADRSELATYIGGFAEDVKEMSQGAFAPIWRQPFVQAILAPLGGWAATILFEGWIGG